MLQNSKPNPFRSDSGIYRIDDGLQIRGAAMLRDEILAKIPTTFGRLVALASFRVPSATDYRHTRLDEAFPPSVVTSILGRAHHGMFADWLAHSLEDQHKQLSEFFADNPEARPCFPLEVRLGLIPPGAKTAEETLFLADLDCLCDLMGIQR